MFDAATYRTNPLLIPSTYPGISPAKGITVTMRRSQENIPAAQSCNAGAVQGAIASGSLVVGGSTRTVKATTATRRSAVTVSTRTCGACGETGHICESDTLFGSDQKNSFS